MPPSDPPAMPDFELHRWFSEDELERCPACRERAAVPLTSTQGLMCFACGDLSPAQATPRSGEEPAAPDEAA